MSKLLAANFSRLRRSKVFWLCFAAILIIGAVYMLNVCHDAGDFDDLEYCIDQYYFNFLPFIGVVIAAFSGLFLGTEYSDGTMRNKVIAGNRRSSIYLANYITVSVAALGFLFAYLISGLVGIPRLGAWTFGIKPLLLFVFLAVVLSAALSAILTFLAMMFDKKAEGVVIAILLMFALVICASILYNALQEPEMISSVVSFSYNDDSVISNIGDPIPNPKYVSGEKRLIYTALVDILPTGQAILIANCEVVRPVVMLVGSFGIIILFTALGIILFRKKDLK